MLEQDVIAVLSSTSDHPRCCTPFPSTLDFSAHFGARPLRNYYFLGNTEELAAYSDEDPDNPGSPSCQLYLMRRGATDNVTERTQQIYS